MPADAANNKGRQRFQGRLLDPVGCNSRVRLRALENDLSTLSDALTTERRCSTGTGASQLARLTQGIEVRKLRARQDATKR
jgi:hypothetical protein